MEYEEVVKRWAAGRLGVAPDQVISVEFDTTTDGYESSGYYGIVRVDARLADGTRSRVEVQGYELGQMIRELVAFAVAVR